MWLLDLGKPRYGFPEEVIAGLAPGKRRTNICAWLLAEDVQIRFRSTNTNQDCRYDEFQKC
jgi:hypothetical protein